MKNSCKSSAFIFLLLMIAASCELIDDASPYLEGHRHIPGQPCQTD